MATGRLLIATTNPAKLQEYRLILRGVGIDLELVSLVELGISETPEETGATFTARELRRGPTTADSRSTRLAENPASGRIDGSVRAATKMIRIGRWSTKLPAG